MRTDLQRLKRDTETGRVGVASSGTVAVAQDSGSHVVTVQPVPVPGGVASSSAAVKAAEVPAVAGGRKLWKILVPRQKSTIASRYPSSSGRCRGIVVIEINTCL